MVQEVAKNMAAWSLFEAPSKQGQNFVWQKSRLLQREVLHQLNFPTEFFRFKKLCFWGEFYRYRILGI